MKRNHWVILAIVAALGLMVWSGYTNFRHRKQSAAHRLRAILVPDMGTGNKSVQQDVAADEGLPNLRGRPAPAFTLRNLEGKKVSLADYKGKAVLINFWATWCAPCKIEIPWFVDLHEKYAKQGFEILGVSEDDSTVTRADLLRFRKELNIDYPILRGSDAVSRRYGGVEFLPTSFFVGRDGKIVAETAGLASKDEVEANIKKALDTTGRAAK